MYFHLQETYRRNTINDIILYTKMFSGDIFGSAVRDYKLSGNIKIRDIDIRLEPNLLKPFLTLLNTRYIIDSTLPPKYYNGIRIESFKISLKDLTTGTFEPIFLDIVIMTKKLFKVSFIDFDVNLLTENDLGLYMRIVPQSIQYIPDKFNHIKERIQNRTFCTINIRPERTHTDTCNLIDKAVEMTADNWTMDDLGHVKPTWIVGKWENIINGRNRKQYSREKFMQMISANICSLCHEEFKPQDIIFNTSCNHNFHWVCSKDTGGLCHWVTQHEKTCCPFCRSEMF